MPHGGISEGSGRPFPSAYTELFEPTKIAGFAENGHGISYENFHCSHTTNRNPRNTSDFSLLLFTDKSHASEVMQVKSFVMSSRRRELHSPLRELALWNTLFVAPAVLTLPTNRAMVGPCVTFSFPLTRLDILIQAEKVAWIILRFDRDHLVPTSLVGFRDAVLLVTTHEIYVHAGFHGRP